MNQKATRTATVKKDAYRLFNEESWTVADIAREYHVTGDVVLKAIEHSKKVRELARIQDLKDNAYNLFSNEEMTVSEIAAKYQTTDDEARKAIEHSDAYVAAEKEGFREKALTVKAAAFENKAVRHQCVGCEWRNSGLPNCILPNCFRNNAAMQKR
ncbi:MAG: hypothetical protein RR415_12010 [Ruthenibacterium sp.]